MFDQPSLHPESLQARRLRRRRPLTTFVLGALLITAAITADAVAETRVVTTTLDSGPGSLFAAIQEANSGTCLAPCVISFAIDGPLPLEGYFTIQSTPASPLVITNSDITIDGTTEAAHLGVTSNSPLVVLDGTAAGSGSDGIRITATGADVSGVTIRGLGIQNFANGAGINAVPGVYSVRNIYVFENYIGITPAGVAAPNAVGVRYDVSFGSIGSSAGTGNVISGNSTAGIIASGAYFSIAGNFIGTSPSGTAPVPNGYGIIFESGGYWVDIGSMTAPNVIAFNSADAITIRNTAGGISIVRNSIHDNGFGINLHPSTGIDGATPNDPGDVDTGGNGVQNFPVLTGVSFDGTNTMITGSLSTVAIAGYTYRIDFFANTLPDPSGYGQGESWIGEVQVSPDAGGFASFSAAIPGDFTAKYISATAAMSGAPPGMAGWTSQCSEFSQLIESDLSITITDTPDPVIPTGALTYGVTIRNAGPAAANNVLFSIIFDPSIASYSMIPPPGFGCLAPPPAPPGFPPAPPAFQCTALAPMGPGTQSFTATAVAPLGVAILSTTAAIGSQSPDPVPSNNGPVGASTTVNGVADLAISAIDTPDPVLAGGVIDYLITITNAGPNDAESVNVSFTFDPTGAALLPPAGWQCVEAIPDPPPGYQGPWAPPSMFGCMPFAPLPPGTYTFQAHVSPYATSGTYTMTAHVQTSSVDPDTTNNGPLAVTTAIGLSADLGLSLTGGPPVAGAVFSYTLLVTNSGPSSISGARLLDTLNLGVPGKKRLPFRHRTRPVEPALAGETWDCAATTGSACGAASGSGDVDVLLDIAAGGSASVEVSAPIPSTATGTLTHSTYLILPPGVTDPTPAGNTSLVTLPLTLSADLSVAISRAPVTPQAGGAVTYTMLVWNSGPSAVVGARLSDVLPTGLSDAQWDCTPSVGAVCSAPAGFGDVDVLLDLSVGAQVVITLDATIAPSITGTLTNTATMTPPAGTADPDGTNNAATDSVSVEPCPAGPDPLSPIGTAIDNPATVTFSWSDAGATSYELFLSVDGAGFAAAATSSGTSVSIPVSAGTISWYVVAVFGACRTDGPQATFTVRVCLAPEAPVPFLVGEVNSDERFTFSWTTPDPDVSFEYRDSPTKEFGDTAWMPTTATEVIFTYTNVNVTPVDYWFQVRAVRDCPLGELQSSPSPAVHIVIRPAGTGSDSANVENGQGRIVNQLLRICANAQGHIVPCNDPLATAAGVVGAFDVPVTITTDQPWMTVTPATTTIPPGGASLTVTSNPQGLPTGTNTGSVVVAQPGGSTSNVPFSVNVVTPVSPQPKTPTRDALIIPAVAHSDGIGSRWQSDIRVTNLALQPITYELSFTPSGVDGTISGKKTEVTIEPGETKALDDVVKQWYGLGSLGDGTNGVLEIRPSDPGKRTGATSVERFSTVASSRTYNSTPDGTYGQWIPAVPLAEFVGRDPGDGSATLSLQHITHSASYRTNLGIVEGAGAAARVVVSVFDASGTKVDEFTRELKAMEHQQLNSFLGEKGIILENGRIEVKVTEGQGRITAYASVIDSSTNDPLFVPAVNAGAHQALRYVVPGLADLDTGVNCWRSDLLIFNPSSTNVDSTIVFYAQNDPATTRTTRLSIPPRQVRVLDDALQTLFGLTGIGGAVHVVPDSSGSLVVTARTYDQRESGTYGQFIAAVTAEDAVGVDDRALEILQIEQSDRYRTNLGLVEVSGRTATVEVSAIAPLSTVAPKMLVTLPANGFKQLLNVLQQMNLRTVYNVRLSVKVVGGEGRVSAYGSVIDQRTQDPTYVKAQ